MNNYFLLLAGLLLTSWTQAQTIPTPQPGYTYKVETGVASQQVFISGQRPFNTNGELVGAGDLAAQTRQVFENLKTALGTVGMTLRDVTQITYHLKGVAGQVNPAASQLAANTGAVFFPQGAPPRVADTKSIAKIVRDDVLIEVEVIAIK
ncbi:RidA family protein [Spirosoma soli]|uniref:RidA family protein n=1 Tax=Spirosoma soli TaxID=1770529 RepID=A0ABW5M8X7_9BACT